MRQRPERMLSDELGYPQIAALLILLQRGLEELHSQRNTRRLLHRGAVEAGRDYYPVVAISHAAWIASLAFLIPSDAPVHWAPLLAFLLLQPVRYWIIGTLGVLDSPHHYIVGRANGGDWSLSSAAPSQLCSDTCRDTTPPARLWSAGTWLNLYCGLGRSSLLQNPAGGPGSVRAPRQRGWHLMKDEPRSTRPLPVIAVGGGLAGAAFAIELARHGVRRGVHAMWYVASS
jgi:hypothetical protein